MAEPGRSRRVLVTGLSTYWGGRLAQSLEEDPSIEAIIGVDDKDPTRELERTEFVRVGNQHALLRRLVDAAQIDTVIDTRLVVDSVTTSASKAHENNVIGTMNILTACSGADSSVRKFIFKSSAHYYGAEQDDPAFFTESMGRPHPPRTRIERDICEGESAVRDFADKNERVTVSMLRFANVLGSEVRTSHTQLFSLPAVPMILGFDPRYQFVHEDDVVNALKHAEQHDLPGIYNVAGDGVLALTEVIDLLGKRYAPVLPPFGTGLAASALRRIGLDIPPEMLNQMRFGRGVDNRRLKATGFAYRYTTRETVLAFGEHLRLHPILRNAREPYQYEREVEEFLRWSPSVRAPAEGPGTRVSPRRLVELQRLLASYAEASGISIDAANEETARTTGRREEQAAAVFATAAEAEQKARAAEARADRKAEAAALEAERRAAEVAAQAERLAEQAAERAERKAEEVAARMAAEAAAAALRADPAATGAEGVGSTAAGPGRDSAAPPTPVEHYDDLEAEEIISLLGSLERRDLEVLRDHERSTRDRSSVLRAIEGLLARRAEASR